MPRYPNHSDAHRSLSQSKRYDGRTDLRSELRGSQGYDLAEELLDEVGIDVAASGTSFDAWLADWRIHVDEITLDDPELRAVSFVSAHHAPRIVLNQSHWSARIPQARRFTLAHELCHLLHDRSSATSLAVATGPWAPLSIEQRANAFAAWLLMPPDRLNSAIRWAEHPISTPEGVLAVAGELEVSKPALIEHLGNLGFLSEEDRHRLRLEL